MLSPDLNITTDAGSIIIKTNDTVGVYRSGNTTLIKITSKQIPETLVEEPNEILLKATESLMDLDTSEAEKELEEIANTLTIEERVKDSITHLDETINNTGRVNAIDKFLLNCPTDLNQLVPFKYGFSWDYYLGSCEQHWMPTEVDMTKDKDDFAEMNPSHKAIILRAWYNHHYQNLLLPISSVLNYYRLITNPECRQYILRQSFEMCLTKHAWQYMTDSLVDEESLAVHEHLGKGTKLRQSIASLDDTFKERYRLVNGILNGIHDRDFNTDTVENTGKFIFELFIAFGYVNWIMQLPTYYQIMNLCRSKKQLQGVYKLISLMLRDIKTQSDFLKYLLKGLIEENPQAVNQELKEHLLDYFKRLLNLELDMVSLSASDENEYGNVRVLLEREIAELLNIVGIDYEMKSNDVSGIEDFLIFLDGLVPSVKHTTTTGGMALQFD